MIPHIGEMALDRVASHCVEKFYLSSTLSIKEEIAKQLLEKEEELEESFSGRIVMRNCKVKEYGEEREKWTEKQNQSLRRKEMFKDLLEEVNSIKFSYLFCNCIEFHRQSLLLLKRSESDTMNLRKLRERSRK